MTDRKFDPAEVDRRMGLDPERRAIARAALKAEQHIDIEYGALALNPLGHDHHAIKAASESSTAEDVAFARYAGSRIKKMPKDVVLKTINKVRKARGDDPISAKELDELLKAADEAEADDDDDKPSAPSYEDVEASDSDDGDDDSDSDDDDDDDDSDEDESSAAREIRLRREQVAAGIAVRSTAARAARRRAHHDAGDRLGAIYCVRAPLSELRSWPT